MDRKADALLDESVAMRIDAVFRAQRAHRWALKTSSAASRQARLRRLRELVAERADAVQEAVFKDLSRPPEPGGSPEVRQVLDDIDFTIATLDAWMAPAEVKASFPGTRAAIKYEARGVVLVFGPWNVPFGLLFQPLVAAVAAGNAVMLKPSEMAPATARISAEIIEAAFPDEEVALFLGGPEVAEALLEHPIDHVFFTGSTAVGRRVMAAAAQHLASVTLELGGRCPAIVDESADVRGAAEAIMRAKLRNAGQVCIAPDHVFVHRDVSDEFVQACLDVIADSVYVGGAFDPSLFGRIVNESHFDRISSYVDDAAAGGARVLGSGNRNRARLTIEPVLLVDVPENAVIRQHEVFGPVLPVFTFDRLSDVVDELREEEKPLATYVFSSDQDSTDMLLAGTSSGGVTVNGWATHCLDRALPFGGVNHSGHGAYHGIHGFRELSHARAVVEHSV